MFKAKNLATKFHIKNETHRETLLKFIAPAMILAAYFIYELEV